MVKTDVTAYFDSIQHRLLFAQIEALNPEPRISQALRRMLNEWSSVPGVGIPQGPDASRVLGNMYLMPVDQGMASGPWVYLRYMDDVRVLGRTRSEAIAGVRVLEKECKKLGLALSAKKTNMLTGAAAIADFEDEELRVAQYWMAIGPGEEASRRLRAILKGAIQLDGTVQERRARFSLWRLALLRDHYALRIVLSKLEELAPLASIVAAYLRPWVSRKRVAEGISRFLTDPERNTSPFLSAWLTAAMLERPGAVPEEWVKYGRTVLFDRNQPPYQRILAASLVSRGRLTGDMAALKRQVGSEFDPAIVRGALVALARVRALDKGTAERARVRFPQLSKTIEYLRGRSTLPSLVYADRTVRIE
jgi:hypothetical protein